ncbi:unnamed protein product [Rotaria sordida]|uniref:Uncharacterized protein n=1 Tax=Rotaria sordida TaxID=392033 RepID=A0A819RLA1_9BILA|nr:unnamed protein product [Rotaria sordida]CAF4054390.1 unnamed protein product [Rotaria sordida]
MGLKKTNAKGRQLQELLNEGVLNCIEDDSPTYETNNYEEKIDWILPLTFEIPLGAEPKPTSPRISYNFQEVKWTKFRQILDEHLVLWDNTRLLNTTTDIEEYTSFITDSITSATQQTIPTSKQINSRYAPSEATKCLIKSKHQAYCR